MELSLMLAEQIFSMVLLCFAGFLFTRTGTVSPEGSRVLSAITVYLVLPCSIIFAFQTELDEEKLSGLGLACLAAVIIHVVSLVLTQLFTVLKHPLDPVEQASVIYNNAGNLVIPMIYGTLGGEYVFYTSVFIAVQNLLMWTHGQKLMGAKANVKKLLLNPCLGSVLLGVAFFFSQITLSGPIGIAVNNVALCVGPFSMLMIGMVLGTQNLKEVFGEVRVYYVVALRLILYPLFALGVLLWLNTLWVHSDSSNILTVSLLCAVGPTAATIAQQAQLYQNPKRVYVSSINVVSTMFCCVTMPVMVLLFQWCLAQG